MAIYFYENDPLAKGLSLVQVPSPQPTPTALPISITGGLPPERLYSPGTEEFSRWAAYATVLSTVEKAQEFAPSPTKWHGGITLVVDVRAGVDLNAGYDRTGLYFFYGSDPVRGRPAYTSDSPDVVSHECGHAILDALRPQYWDTPFEEVAAFHESFGDISALLTTLSRTNVVQAALDAGLDNHNPGADLAEELGTALYHIYGPDAAPPDYLRSGINDFKYQPPESLPKRAPDPLLSGEPHSFSRVFTGAFYDLLVGLFERIKAQETGDPAKALEEARSTAGRLVYGAVQRTRPQARFYRALAGAMLGADQRLFSGTYTPLLRDVFQKRQIPAAPPPKPRIAPELEPVLESFSFRRGIAPGELARREVMAEITNQAASVAGPLGFEAGRTLHVQQVFHDEGAIYVDMASPRPHQLRGAELGVADGAVVELGEMMSLEFDRESGKAVAGDIDRPTEEDVKFLHESVLRLVSKRQVGYRGRGLRPPTLAELMLRKQPFYVAEDARGVKRLYRAYFDCIRESQLNGK